jgi:hypothetical protein
MSLTVDDVSLDALGPAPRTELLHVLMLPHLDGAERIGASGPTRGARLAELLRPRGGRLDLGCWRLASWRVWSDKKTDWPSPRRPAG